MAAVPSRTAALAPEVTMPASAPVASRMVRLAAAWSWTMSTQARLAWRIASATSGAMRPPERRVTVPQALMISGTPRSE